MSYREQQAQDKRAMQDGIVSFCACVLCAVGLLIALLHALDKYEQRDIAMHASACTLVEREVMKTDTDEQGNTIVWSDFETMCE